MISFLKVKMHMLALDHHYVEKLFTAVALVIVKFVVHACCVNLQNIVPGLVSSIHEKLVIVSVNSTI